MSLLSQWNLVKDNLIIATNKTTSVKGGVDKPDTNNTSTNNTNVDTTSETYLKSLFEQQNKWNCTRLSRPSGSNAPSRSDIGYALAKARTTKSAGHTGDWAWADSYVGVRECYVYCSQDYTLSTTVYTDDAGSAYLNGTQLKTMGSCANTTVSFPFKKGLNHVELCFNEGSGADCAYMTTNLSTQSWVKWMFARYKNQ